MNSLEAFKYCRLYIDEESKSINRNLGYIYCHKNRVMASNGVSMIICKIDGNMKTNCVPVAKYLKGEESKNPLFRYFEKYMNTQDPTYISFHYSPSASNSFHLFKQWEEAFRVIRKIVKENHEIDVFKLRDDIKGLLAFAANEKPYSTGVCYKLISCRYYTNQRKKSQGFWYNVQDWLTMCKVMKDFKPQAFDMAIAENGIVDFYAGDDIRIKFTPVRAEACKKNNFNTDFFAENLS